MNNKEEKLLIICGPTATGKTGMALYLAEVFNGDIVSADSRQVYKDMNVGTGKDIPRGSTWHLSDLPQPGHQLPIGYWQTGKSIKIWGYDLVTPLEEFSVSQYAKTAKLIIKNILSENKLPIIVGGTGLYIKGVIDGIDTSAIPRNSKLRNFLKDMTATELFEKLAQVDPIKAASLNTSDKKNPRRLIRAIEIAQWNLNNEVVIEKYIKRDTLFIGLTVKAEQIEKNVKERIEKRLDEGVIDEIKKLLMMGVTWDYQSMNTLGYKEFRSYFEGNKSLQEAINEWEKDEKRYVKRQLTWFKKDKRIAWFNISDKDWEKDIEKVVVKWYSSSSDSNLRIYPNDPNM